ncbi:MAG: sodium:sulfate symporter, partial [Thermodesulfobacteriota bacterium]|nr:sodium:sulfate symporter [Thermodesulfobacteriota bacterium]
MAGEKTKAKASGYDKYIDWKVFIIPVVLCAVILLLPTPYGMKDVGMEYRVGPKAVINYVTTTLFETPSSEAEQWQLLTAQIMEQNLNMGALTKERFLKRDVKWCKGYKIPVVESNLVKAQAFVNAQVAPERFKEIMASAMELRKDGLAYEALNEKDRVLADKGAWHIKAAIVMMVFVVGCFLTECIPLPGVAFCIGVFLVATGLVTRHEVAMLYWS